MEFLDDDPNNMSKFICKFCHKSILGSNIIQHLKTIHEDLVKDSLNIKKYQCPICRKEFKRKWDLDLHEKQHAEGSELKPFE